MFMGQDVSRNEEWLDITGSYAIVGFEYIRALRHWPAVARPVIQYLLPERRRMWRQEHAARRIVSDELDKRRREKVKSQKAGSPPKVYSDALQWLGDVQVKCRQRIDIPAAQLSLGLAGIHTTSMTLTRAMFDLIDNPEWIQPLRDEINLVLRDEGGWKKSTLHKLKLMDSVFKESQRRNPIHLSK